MHIKTFVFNPFQVNTYLLYDASGSCIIIDPACNNAKEHNELTSFIKDNSLTPQAIYNTHCHIDHIAGNFYLEQLYKIPSIIHPAGEGFLKHAKGHAQAFGFNLENTFIPASYINDGDTISFGLSQLKVLYTPGHADGSVCFLATDNKFVITGDVLFNGSIGRTDLPSGNFDLLIESIENKLLTLPGDTLVYPGHGESTSISREKAYNPFL